MTGIKERYTIPSLQVQGILLKRYLHLKGINSKLLVLSILFYEHSASFSGEVPGFLITPENAEMHSLISNNPKKMGKAGSRKLLRPCT